MYSKNIPDDPFIQKWFVHFQTMTNIAIGKMTFSTYSYKQIQKNTSKKQTKKQNYFRHYTLKFKYFFFFMKNW